jgi:dTMP kinase
MVGKFITCEGGDGCGKSTQLGLLFDALFNAGVDAVRTREPGGTEGANAIRKLLVEGDYPWDGVSESLLHFAARRDHVEKLIKPRLERDEWVVCDRFVDSTMAYQGYGYELDKEFIEQLHKLTIDNFKPDLTLIFDIDVEQGLKRTRSRGDAEDRYEKMDVSFHHRLREGFLAIAENDAQRCVLIDAVGSIADVHANVITTVNNRFGLSLKTVDV